MADDICKSCGARNPAQTEFCQTCGTYLRWDATRTNLPPVTGPLGQTQPSGEPLGLAQPGVAAAESRPAISVPPPSPTARPALRPGEHACPNCRTANGADRRFCAKCGHVLQRMAAGAPRPTVAASTDRRWFERFPWVNTDGPDPDSVKAYRRSLSPRARWTRVVGSLVAVAAVGGGLAIAGHNPATMARHLRDRITDRTVPIEVTARTDSKSRSSADAQKAVDDKTDTAWTANWISRTETNVSGRCGTITKGGDASLSLKLPGPTEVRRLTVFGSVKDEDARSHQWTPRVLQLTFSDGSCVRVSILSRGTTEVVKLAKPVTTSSVKVEIAAADKPLNRPPIAPRDQISISEITLYQRPT